MGWLSNKPIADPTFSLPPKPTVKKYPFQTTAKRLKMNENVKGAHFRTHWLAAKWWHEQSFSFCQSPKWVNTDRAHYGWSSSGLIAIVVMMTLFSIPMVNWHDWSWHSMEWISVESRSFIFRHLNVLILIRCSFETNAEIKNSSMVFYFDYFHPKWVSISPYVTNMWTLVNTIFCCR